MAQARETSFNPSSPHSSSGGADSYKHEGTPDTRLTAFSPDDSSARSNKLLKTLSLNASSDSHHVRFHANLSSEGYLGGPVGAEMDPFVSSTTSAPKSEQKLSPTASAFRPVSISLVAHGSLNSMPGLNIGPSADMHLGLHSTARFSTELRLSRYLFISAPSKAVSLDSVEGYISKLERCGSQCQGKCRHVPVTTGVYIRLTNIRDARTIYENVQLGGPDWRAKYIHPAEFYQVVNPGAQYEAVSEGQVYVMALPDRGINLSASQIESIVHGFLQSEGDIFAFQPQADAIDVAFRALVEFSDVDVAISIASKFNGISLNGIQVLLTLYHPDTTTVAPDPLATYASSRNQIQDIADMIKGMSVSKTPQPVNALATAGRHGQSPLALHVPQQQIAMYPVVYHSQLPGPVRYMVDHTPTRSQSMTPMTPLTPMSGSVPIMGPIYTPPATPMTLHSDYTSPRNMQVYGRQDRRQNAMRVNRAPYYNAAGHHNHVDVKRIQDGIDVRTTIMLRNIPNKVDQAMLKRIVDESSWGKYDFMYLRIDFANDCNVGYAFINFVDPLDIIDFVNARGNQRWNCFKSDKVAEISYARKDCLVQKFRNSSVMLEPPHYKPKLYFTSNGPEPDLAGKEEPFPDPDNQSKMKRSCENAEHVGLFTPNAGQHFRDEQRRRRSQYDRGTRLAALEEYDFDAHIQQQGLYTSQ
ncbi:RNA recognition motif 2-domain-containing protein [Lasiosphaeria miniovina]|uniref:RNA recognition motif 2-domain-containing protein n=1 Tax=Lasiosphaeria miniovina TaxID=1954250 RepID=A0AA40AM48_9PEZI|nr:RNA recognition motif 2-domain-containing protein [Lasiosphaeria miniovina]KAK0718388.1 RNA recognition motif 2-domain-containing protein [Lasiosphaeria miniovina]